MVKRICALVCALLLPASSLAEIIWPEPLTEGQAALKSYIELVNQNQSQQNRGWVNSLFECYPTFAALGMTTQDMAEIPEGVELSFTMENGYLDTLQLRVNDPSRFPTLAASCIQAASPTAITLEEALADPAAYADKALKNPNDSFEDPLDTLNGLTPRVYYAYYPNQYRDGTDWLQMTLVFAMPGAADAAMTVTPTPPPADTEQEYDLTDYDGGTHLEVFTTATPEPDSPAGEQ
ncbi:MAG: hypothetical protein E7316_04980 [Clostridiales bacterium]|nr:hypothetical protein [Clostridiales bacterium]